jgi:hypothetical protein
MLAAHYDVALKGVAERARTPLAPVYDWQLAMEIAAERADPLLARWQESPQLWIWRPERTRFWAGVKTGALKTWEGMAPAIAGQAWWHETGPAAAYLTETMLSILAESRSWSGNLSEEDQAGRQQEIQAFFERNIVAAWLGDSTPFIITTTL